MKSKIVDNFLNADEFDTINCYLKEAKWSLQTSNETGLDFLYWDVSHGKFFNTTLFDRVQEELQVDTEIERVYFNGQHCGREGELHTDRCDVTALIYISEYNPNWGGFTQIVYSPTDQFIVPPVQGRLLAFDGNMYHKGYSYSYQDCPMRISLAYKLNERTSSNS